MKPVPRRRPNPRLNNPVYEMVDEPELISFQYDIAYGEGTAARPGMVMLRIAREGRLLVEEHMPPEEFLTLAHSIENVARGVEAFTNG